LNQKWPSGKPPWPTDLVTAAIQFDDEIEAARDELFLSGTEATQVSLKRGAALRARIAYPGAGTIVALDPDIPAAVQRMQFAMRPEAHGYSFRIDGEELAVDATWSPVHGKHVLDLIDGTGRIADSVHFTVRGNAGTAKLATH
jgi:penicillin-binding protein 1C